MISVKRSTNTNCDLAHGRRAIWPNKADEGNCNNFNEGRGGWRARAHSLVEDGAKTLLMAHLTKECCLKDCGHGKAV